MSGDYLRRMDGLEKASDPLVRLRGYGEVEEEYYWREGLLEAIELIERFRGALQEIAAGKNEPVEIARKTLASEEC